MPNSCDSCMAMSRRETIGTLIAVFAALALSGCASEETASRFLVPPDRYILYSCPALATGAQTNLPRMRELEALTAKAGPNGQFASELAYRPEYLQLRGEMDQIRKTAGEKNCKPIPGVTGIGVRASDQAVR